MTVRILRGDCREILETLPEASAHCIVTSPPYWGLRDYGVPGQLGLEPTPEEYVEKMVAVFREVRRVLRDDGTLWLNLGDSYAGSGRGAWNISDEEKKARGVKEVYLPKTRVGGTGVGDTAKIHAVERGAGMGRLFGCKAKDLVGIPWRVAFALQADGWYLRQDIIWAKPNPMPESVRDRCTKSHEYLFLLAKSGKYYCDMDSIAEQSVGTEYDRTKRAAGRMTGAPSLVDGRGQEKAGDSLGVGSETRNKRSVWTVPTVSFSDAHFATFPPALIEPCILAGCPKDCCAKCGAPVVRVTDKSQSIGRRHNGAGDGLTDFGMYSGRAGSSTKATLGWSPSCSCDVGTVRGTVLDPFGGAGTTGLVADRLGRDAILIELNPEYVRMAERRIKGDSPLFAEVES